MPRKPGRPAVTTVSGRSTQRGIEKRQDASERAFGRGTGRPNPIDVHVGKRIRVRRLFLGMNQETLANGLGLTFQQVQKYEGGGNRVSASRLAEMARILDVSIPYFFADMLTESGQGSAAQRAAREHAEEPETIDLLRFYYGISDAELRQQFAALVKTVAMQDQA
jgi:transcriptional regulator with XRE-family HTH domain